MASRERQPQYAPPENGLPLTHASRSCNHKAQAVGAIAIGALAIGALAIGALAIGRLKVGRAHIGRLEIDELIIRKSTADHRK